MIRGIKANELRYAKHACSNCDSMYSYKKGSCAADANASVMLSHIAHAGTLSSVAVSRAQACSVRVLRTLI